MARSSPVYLCLRWGPGSACELDLRAEVEHRGWQLLEEFGNAACVVDSVNVELVDRHVQLFPVSDGGAHPSLCPPVPPVTTPGPNWSEQPVPSMSSERDLARLHRRDPTTQSETEQSTNDLDRAAQTAHSRHAHSRRQTGDGHSVTKPYCGAAESRSPTRRWGHPWLSSDLGTGIVGRGPKPLGDVDTSILAALVDGDLHGYAILAEVREVSDEACASVLEPCTARSSGSRTTAWCGSLPKMSSTDGHGATTDSPMQAVMRWLLNSNAVISF